MIRRKRRATAPAIEWLKDVSGSRPRATMAGAKRVLVENHTGIISLTDGLIRLACSGGEITVTGRELTLSELRRDTAIVEGVIYTVSLPDGEA